MSENSERHITYAEAVAEAIRESLAADPAVALLSGGFMGLDGPHHIAAAIREEFGDRIMTPPISEAAIAGMAVGAAMAGARPIFPIGTGSFMLRAWDQILHEAATARAMSGGKVKVPVVFHLLHGLRGGGGAQHSLSPQAMLWNWPGLEIVLPATPADAKGLFRAAVQSDNPTVFVGHAKLMGEKGPVPEGDYTLPFGKAAVRREGGDVSIVATSLQVLTALAAAETLAADGIEADVIDLRSLRPLDTDTVLALVEKTGRLVVADECPLRCSVASEIAATVAEEGFRHLKAPIARVTRDPVTVPFSPVLEDAIAPSAERIVSAARRVAT